MKEFSKYSQEKDKMLRDFKFFRGISEKQRVFTVQYNYNDIVRNLDAEDELVRLMSQEIANEIDNDIIRRLTRRINGGENQRA